MMRRRSLNYLLSLVFLFFFLLITALGLFSIERLGEFNRASADVRDVWLPSTRAIGDLNNFTSDFRAAEGRYLLSASHEAGSSKKEIESLGRAVEQAEKDYESLRKLPAAAELYAKFKEGWTAYRGIVDEVLELYETGQVSEAVNLYRTTSQSTFDASSDALDRVTRLNVASAAAASDEADAAYRNSRALILVAMGIAAVLIMAALFYVKRYVSKPLLELAGGMRQLAGNDTDIEIRGAERIDEIGEMARALVVFRTNAIELMLSQRSLSQQATMLEERLAQEQRLNQLQQDFVSMASHEFRTPLTVIDAQAQRLAKTSQVTTGAEIAERAGKIRKAVLRMTTVIDKLLNSSRLVDGDTQLYFHPVEIDLRVILDEVCQLHRDVAAQANIHQALGATSLPVLGDAKLLFQMFGNLISNALKYSPDGSLIEVAVAIEGDHVAIVVRDHGMGIPRKDIASVFDRYTRGSNVSGIVGTGVGLYLVKIVAELHGGSVGVESKEDEGSCFTILLPLSRVVKPRRLARSQLAAAEPDHT
ncbi:histidine kinase [Bradyrhizobium sp. SK17]|uniref:sensor histidine kinase n=1 Tax=Bradyrhizobium sp. SK17 TaxID=2057741 RepID=UPI000C3030EC|nr:ATP-binding protein [Bradyrhizobium sp. SK17]AUC97871.1 histidine kinase [Bradyrhizobium sp. SK17]